MVPTSHLILLETKTAKVVTLDLCKRITKTLLVSRMTRCYCLFTLLMILLYVKCEPSDELDIPVRWICVCCSIISLPFLVHMA